MLGGPQALKASMPREGFFDGFGVRFLMDLGLGFRFVPFGVFIRVCGALKHALREGLDNGFIRS